MEPIDVSGYTKDNIRDLAAYCHDLMEKRIAELDEEIAKGKLKCHAFPAVNY